MNILYLIRHGETDWNKESKFLSRTDIPLNEKGRDQAYEALQKLRPLEPDFVYSSYSSRAMTTAAIIGGSLRLPVFPLEFLKERDWGGIEGRHAQEINLGEMELRAEQPFESKENASQRMLKAIKYIDERHFDSKIVVVSHGTVISYFLKSALGLDLNSPDFAIENCSINEIHFSENSFEVKKINGEPIQS